MDYALGQFEEASHLWQSSPNSKNDYAIEGDVVWIRLTQGRCTCIDLADWTEGVKSRRWYAVRAKKTFYAKSEPEQTRLHHVILCRGVDHKNRNGLDNRRSNLRQASKSQQVQNQGLRKDNTTGFKGVHKLPKSFRYRICHDGRIEQKGGFTTAEAAARVYDTRAKELFGRFAVLNFPENSNN